MSDKKINIVMADKCYNLCIKSYQEKLLSPYEKECLKTCLEGMHGLKIEFYNSCNK